MMPISGIFRRARHQTGSPRVAAIIWVIGWRSPWRPGAPWLIWRGSTLSWGVRNPNVSSRRWQASLSLACNDAVAAECVT